MKFSLDKGQTTYGELLYAQDDVEAVQHLNNNLIIGASLHVVNELLQEFFITNDGLKVLMVQIEIKMNIGDLILVTSLSVILVIMYSAENNLSQFSASALLAYDKGKYFVNIQEDSENELGPPTSSLGQNSATGSTNQSLSGVTDESTTNGAMSNDTGEKNSAQGPTNSLDEGTTNGAMSNDTGEENLNQTSESSSSSSAESQSSQNASQNVESQNQLHANQSTEIQNNPQI